MVWNIYSIGIFLWLAVLSFFGILAALILEGVQAPLPWMIGPIITTSLLTLVQSFRAPPSTLRWGGQWIVASAVALNLSPEALRVIGSDLAIMASVAFAGIGVAVVVALCLDRLDIVDRKTGFLILLPGGAAEMAELAKSSGGRPDLVALTQTLRLAITIFIVPITLLAIEQYPVYEPDSVSSQWWQAFIALFLALPVSAWLHRKGFTNAYFIAPLSIVGILALTGLTSGNLPIFLIAGGQVMLGISLGAMLPLRQFVRLRREVLVAVACSLFLVILGVAFAIVLATLGTAPLGQLMLATSAGGVAEMAVAAKAFGLDPAYVIAYHLVRIFLIVTLASLILRLL